MESSDVSASVLSTLFALVGLVLWALVGPAKV
jgi:hypothetical protein